jgi:hypothetical protein
LRIDQPATSASAQIKHQLHSVCQDVPSQHLMHLGRLQVGLFGHCDSFPEQKKSM